MDTQKINGYIDSFSCDETNSASIRLAAIGTAVLWFVIMVILAISPNWHKKEKYKTVRITLEPAVESLAKAEQKKSSSETSSATRQEESATLKQEQAAKTVEPQNNPVQTAKTQNQSSAKQESNTVAKTPATPKQQTSQNQNAATKPAAPKTTESAKPAVPEKKANIKYAKSVDELLSEQTSSSSKTNYDWDDSLNFTENSSSSSNSNTNQNTNSISNALSGNAATSSSDSNIPVTSVTETRKPSGNASSGTTGQLANIVGTKVVSTPGSRTTSSASFNVRSNGNGIEIATNDGKFRTLLSDPKIKFSPQAEQSFSGPVEVLITFIVKANGTVFRSSISFGSDGKSSLLPDLPKEEIINQVAQWEFTPAEIDGQVQFKHSIILK